MKGVVTCNQQNATASSFNIIMITLITDPNPVSIKHVKNQLLLLFRLDKVVLMAGTFKSLIDQQWRTTYRVQIRRVRKQNGADTISNHQAFQQFQHFDFGKIAFIVHYLLYNSGNAITTVIQVQLSCGSHVCKTFITRIALNLFWCTNSMTAVD